jgi:hypothetical protein
MRARRTGVPAPGTPRLDRWARRRARHRRLRTRGRSRVRRCGTARPPRAPGPGPWRGASAHRDRPRWPAPRRRHSLAPRERRSHPRRRRHRVRQDRHAGADPRASGRAGSRGRRHRSEGRRAPARAGARASPGCGPRVSRMDAVGPGPLQPVRARKPGRDRRQGTRGGALQRAALPPPGAALPGPRGCQVKYGEASEFK